MIISHRLKFAFFRVPKTGSTTMELLLRMTGAFDDRDIASPVIRYAVPGLGVGADRIPEPSPAAGRYVAAPHVTPQECIDRGYITIEQLREYSCYAALRDPFDRAVSVFVHAHGRVPEMTKAMFDRTIREGKDYKLLEKPQADYFHVDGEEVLAPVDFGNFVSALNGLLASVPGNTIAFPIIPNFNRSIGKEPEHNRANYVDAHPELKAILTTKLAADVELYERHFGPLG